MSTHNICFCGEIRKISRPKFYCVHLHIITSLIVLLQQEASNEYPQHTCYEKLEKNIPDLSPNTS